VCVCVCVCDLLSVTVSGVLFSVCVCVCVCDLLIVFLRPVPPGAPADHAGGRLLRQESAAGGVGPGTQLFSNHISQRHLG